MKFFKVIIIIFCLLLASVLGVGIYVFASVYDSTNNTPHEIVENDYSMNYIMNREIFHAVKEVNKNDSLDLVVNDYVINEVMYTFVKEINISSVEIKGVYCHYNDDNTYTFELPVNAFGINSVVRGKISLNGDKEWVNLVIHNIKLGSFSLTSSFLKGLVIDKIDTSSIENSLRKQNIESKIDLNNMVISISSDSIIDLAKKQIDEQSAGLFNVFLKTAIERGDLIKVLGGDDNQMGVKINTSLFNYEEVRDGSIYYPLDLESVKELTLSNEHYDASKASVLFNYYACGYDALIDEEKQQIDEMNLDKNYKGIKNPDSLSMADVIKEQSSIDQLAGILLNKSYSLEVSESQFNQLFSTLPMIGSSLVYTFEDDLVYLSVESVDMKIKENYFNIYVVVSLNGKRFVIDAGIESSSKNDSLVVGSLKTLRIGSVKVDESCLGDVMKYLKDMITQNWLSVDENNLTITIDLTSLITDNQLVGALIKNNFECTSYFDASKKLVLNYSMN